MKTNKPGKQNPLFLYVDKIVFGVLVLATVYYCYSAVSLPQITWTPTQLTSDATSAQQNIDRSEYRAELVPDKYDEKALDIRAGIPAAPYQTAERWEAPIFREKIMRGIPETFPVIKLRATDGVGGLMVKDGQSVLAGTAGSSDMGAFGGGDTMGSSMSAGMSSAGGKVETKRWVLLTGLIPYADQLQEYIDKYAGALHTSPMDYPDYLFMKIQRNEIGNNDAGGNPIWEDLDVLKQLAETERDWAGSGVDPVDFQYTLPPAQGFPRMAAIVPPLANRSFGYEVAYPPYIPLMADSLAEQQIIQQKRMDDMLKNQKPVTTRDLFDPESGAIDQFIQGTSGLGGGMSGGGDSGMGGGGSRVSGMYQGTNTSGTGGGASGMRTGMSGDMMSGDMGMGGSMSGGMGNTTSRWVRYMDTLPSVYIDAPYRLFRYFDFSIEPGKAYQYRVSLALRNPNFMLADRFLTDEAVETKGELPLWTDYSLPSGAVAVFSNARVLAQSVNTAVAGRPWQSQTATIASLVYDTEDKVDYIAKDRTVSPGAVLNFRRVSSQKVETPSSMTPTSGSGLDSMSGSPSARTTTTEKTAKTLDHLSGECLLDVVGGRRLVGTNTEHTPAGQIMVMGFDGTLKLQTVKTDKLELGRYEKKATTSSTDGMM